MANSKSLMSIYNDAYDSIIAIMINPKEWKTSKNCKNPSDVLYKRYERKLTSILKPVLLEINKELGDTHKLVKIKKAVVQCNSLHPMINSRLRLPWNMAMKDIPDGGTDILCLHPDRPTHILTEILLRLKPYSNSEQDGKSRKDWVGILKRHRYQCLLNSNSEEEKKNQEYLCPVEWQEDTPELEDFSNVLQTYFEDRRKDNNPDAMVGLGEGYAQSSFHGVTSRVYNWFKKNREETDNAFYLADLAVSEQLAGISAELKIDENATIDDIRDFLKDCQWKLNRYVFSLILQAERSYSGEGPSYPDAYFSCQTIDASGKIEKDYEMLDNLIGPFTPYNLNGSGKNQFNKRYEDCPFNEMEFIKNLFRKIRIHLEITKGEMGKYAIGYKKHAYEVACVIAGIMDVLFYDKSGSVSIETIVRQCSPGLEGIDGRLKKKDVPFLFRQLFKGLSKEDQLFLIPQYREHFIHSFYVFVFGIVMMFYAPSKVIDKRLSLNSQDDEKIVKNKLKKWFLVSMWHDIAYMIEKGNLVLEQHILSLMREGRREKGLLPWLPSLGNLMQVDKLLEEIRELSEGSIEICPKVLECIKDRDLAERLISDIVIAAAFERRDHGVWSAMMLNHAWDQNMTRLYFGRSNVSKKLQDGLLRDIAKAIIPHHLADWDVRQILKDYDRLKKVFPSVCATPKTFEKLCKGEPIKCDFVTKCLRPVFIIPNEGNELGYLLGICDMLSQAGRENTELPKDTASKLGIKYRDIQTCGDSGVENSLQVLLKYKEPEDMDDSLFLEYYTQPALFLGLSSKPKQSESLMISAGGCDDISNDESKCFFLTSLDGETE